VTKGCEKFKNRLATRPENRIFESVSAVNWDFQKFGLNIFTKNSIFTFVNISEKSVLNNIAWPLALLTGCL
jgi:hypothetical protein